MESAAASASSFNVGSVGVLERRELRAGLRAHLIRRPLQGPRRQAGDLRAHLEAGGPSRLRQGRDASVQHRDGRLPAKRPARLADDVLHELGGGVLLLEQHELRADDAHSPADEHRELAAGDEGQGDRDEVDRQVDEREEGGPGRLGVDVDVGPQPPE